MLRKYNCKLSLLCSAQNTNGDSTADSGDDWTINANSITIANGSSSATATITVVNDTTPEAMNHCGDCNIADNSVARVKGSEKSATITIQDNEVLLPTATTSPIVHILKVQTINTNCSYP